MPRQWAVALLLESILLRLHPEEAGLWGSLSASMSCPVVAEIHLTSTRQHPVDIKSRSESSIITNYTSLCCLDSKSERVYHVYIPCTTSCCACSCIKSAVPPTSSTSQPRQPRPASNQTHCKSRLSRCAIRPSASQACTKTRKMSRRSPIRPISNPLEPARTLYSLAHRLALNHRLQGRADGPY